MRVRAFAIFLMGVSSGNAIPLRKTPKNKKRIKKTKNLTLDDRQNTTKKGTGIKSQSKYALLIRVSKIKKPAITPKQKETVYATNLPDFELLKAIKVWYHTAMSIGSNPFKQQRDSPIDIRESLRPLLGDEGVALMEAHVELPAPKKLVSPVEALSEMVEDQSNAMRVVFEWLRDFFDPEELSSQEIDSLLSQGIDGITFKTDLNLEGKGISAIPIEFFRIRGNLNLAHNRISHIKHFPKIIRGSVDLSGNPLIGTKGLEGVSISGDLKLNNTYANTLPPTTEVEGQIFAINSLAREHAKFAKIEKGMRKLRKVLNAQGRNYVSWR